MISAPTMASERRLPMNIEIRKLTPALVQDYTHFFDTTPHNNSGKNDKCYCITFCKDCVYDRGDLYWYPTPKERREHGIARVQNGEIHGYLAYCDGEIVGWCNAGDKNDYSEVINHMRSNNIPVDKCCPDEKIKFIFCFAIAPKVQRMGIASQLIEYICEDAKSQGFDFVESHTHNEFLRDGFRGTLKMYEKQGFQICAENNHNIIVRKSLK